jgi:hypothetical protein
MGLKQMRMQWQSYFSDLENPYMGIDAVAISEQMENGNMPHMVVDKEGHIQIIKDADETGWTPHPDLPQPNYTVGLKLDDNGRASEAQLDRLREIRSAMTKTDALASYSNGADGNSPQQGYIRLGSEIANTGDMRAALGMQSKVSDITRAWEDMPASFRLGFIRAKQAIHLSAARVQDEIGEALDEVAALQEEYETLKAQTGAKPDTGWAESLYNDLMHNMGTYSPVIAGSTATGTAASAATPLAGFAVGGITAMGLNAAIDHGRAILSEMQEMAVDLTDPEAMRVVLNDAGQAAEEMLDKANTEAVYGSIRGAITSLAPIHVMKSLPVQKYVGQLAERMVQPAISGAVSGASRIVEYTAKQLDGLATKIAGQFDTSTITHAAAGLFDMDAQASAPGPDITARNIGNGGLATVQNGLATHFHPPASGLKPVDTEVHTPPQAKPAMPGAEPVAP